MSKTCILVNILRQQPNVNELNERLLSNIMDTNQYVDIDETDLPEHEVKNSFIFIIIYKQTALEIVFLGPC
jgi:hypothetical protein